MAIIDRIYKINKLKLATLALTSLHLPCLLLRTALLGTDSTQAFGSNFAHDTSL